MNLKLKARIYIQFAIAVLPLTCVLVYQLLAKTDLPAQVNRTLQTYDTALQASANYKSFLDGVGDALDSGKLGEKSMRALASAKSNADKLVSAQPTSSGGKRAVEKLAKIQIALTANNSLESLLPLKQDINDANEALSQATVDVKEMLSSIVAEDSKSTEKKELLQTGVAVLTLLLIAFILRNMVLGIVAPIAFAARTAQLVAGGDLSTTIIVNRHDEIGNLQQALVDMQMSLNQIVGKVRSSTELIGSAATQIAAGNADLSARTDAQASSLEETASSMEEFTSTVTQNAENAREANTLALSASEIATRGGNVVSQVVNTMGSISESSKKIVDIIGVIDGIAFQTNILALNAAVEAARAGEQGRGFAVVATEVRNLAQRSAAAAKEIKHLINDSVAKVGYGSQQVEVAGATMQEIVDSIKRVAAIMGEITAASREQTAGISQVKTTIDQLDLSTQQNATLTEDAAMAARSLTDQAANLLEKVSIFTLSKSQTLPAAVNTAKPKSSERRTPSLTVRAKPSATIAHNRVKQSAPEHAALAGAKSDWEEF